MDDTKLHTLHQLASAFRTVIEQARAAARERTCDLRRCATNLLIARLERPPSGDTLAANLR